MFCLALVAEDKAKNNQSLWLQRANRSDGKDRQYTNKQRRPLQIVITKMGEDEIGNNLRKISWVGWSGQTFLRRQYIISELRPGR